ncbi:hypothetical protein DFH08DRAFT_945380 [Mycena albidolilacea]|uniref:Uncharacterized protein n=1 Tax=Mycena albidolilacea TaxID=1033008 RepID=A0AAD7E8J5_9AGAR|nr:hypothetical protein DFH08DRAFT_945380 [Mycena albidolilacea]
MHPAVKMDNLECLPADMRPVAIAACESGRSLQDFHRMDQLFVDAPPSQKLLFFQVLYSGLDPAQVPSPKDLEPLEADTMTRIGCASLSLKGIFRLFEEVKEPEEIGPTLWPNVWPWMYLIHEHWNYLPATVVLPEFFMYCEFLGFVGRIYVPSLYRPIVLVVLAKAWSFLPQLKGSMAFEPCFKYLAGIIGALDFSDPVHFAEMVDGAGGTLDDLACLTKRYLDDLAGKKFESGWPGILKLWMPPSLVHYPVVAAVNEILVDLHEISSRKDFQALDIFDEWITFIDLAERRVALMRRVDSTQWLKACDNLDVCPFQRHHGQELISGSTGRFKPGLSADGAPDAAPTTTTLGAKLSIGRAAGTVIIVDPTPS